MSNVEPALAYTVDEVARLLRVGRTTVFAKIRSGALPSLVIGRSRRVSARALAAFIAKGEETEAEKASERGKQW